MKRHKITPQGRYALAMSNLLLSLRASDVGIVLYPDGSGRVLRSIPPDQRKFTGCGECASEAEEEIIYSFNHTAQLYVWLHSDLETRARMARESRGTDPEELEQALRDLAKPETIQ